MLLSSKEGPDAEFLNLGAPLAECESEQLPDPRVPCGSWDHQDVHFDPIHGFTILLLGDWFGKGQLVRLPLPLSRQDAEARALRSTVIAFATPILPDSSQFMTRWLGANCAIIYSEEEMGSDPGPDFLFRLVFKFNKHAEDPTADTPDENRDIPEASGYEAMVIREGLKTDVNLLYNRPFVFDEQSRRMCITDRHGDDQTELYVFRLGADT